MFLVACLCFGIFISASPSALAATTMTYSNGYMYRYGTEYFGDFIASDRIARCIQEQSLIALIIDYFNSWVGFTSVGPCTMDELNMQMQNYSNSFYSRINSLNANVGLKIHQSGSGKAYRIYDYNLGDFVVDAEGQYPFALVTGDAPEKGNNYYINNTTVVDDSIDLGSNTWILYDNAVKASTVHVISIEKMDDIIAALNPENYATKGNRVELTVNGTKYYVIYRMDSSSRRTYYADSGKRLYVAALPGTSAANQSHNYYTEYNTTNNNTTNNYDYGTTVETQIIDNSVDNSTNVGTLNIIHDSSDHSTTNNITEYNIESLIYDDSTHSYVANTYQVEYDATNNYYEYKYYTYNIQYNITNTYVTYIGSNDAYQQEEYRYYYELPDGRSSADLTADEIAGMSFQFSDCVNYARSATDTSLRALYHFDGNTDDSGYFGTQTAFTWTQGASITYMDSSAFNGALYLDETAHKFTVTLPSALGSGDFTIQWRYYQASQADTVDNRENTFSIGSTKLFTWDERSYYWDNSSTACAPVGIGTWNEVALVRHSTMLYLYINGLKVAEKSVNTPYGNEFTFTFGSTSRAYSMLDELRVVNFAVAKSGASYTPTDVPYDTNLVLVLPDSAFPIADEYYEYHLPENAIFASPFNLGKLPDGVSYSKAGASANIVKVSFFDDYTTISAGSSSMSYSSSGGFQIYGSGTQQRYVYDDGDPDYVTGSCLPAGDYTFTVVTLDGEVYSLPVTLLRSSQTFVASNGYHYYYFNRLATGSDVKVSGSSRYKYLDCGSFYMSVFSCDAIPTSTIQFGTNTAVTFHIVPKSGNYLDLIYASIIPGSAPDDAVEKVSCIYSSEEVKPNTAAIQSDIPVKGYTVGGVRPTFPQRGDVWMSVNGSRISGVQIYNGRAWESTNARYYTGTRWIPIYAFDIQTLEDCWDIADGDDAVPPISTEEGFWGWWQRQWLDFTKWIKNAWENLMELLSSALQGGDSGVRDPSDYDDKLPGETTEDEDDSWSLLDLIGTLTDGVWSVVKGVISMAFGGFKGLVSFVSDIGGFFTNAGDVMNTIKDFGG